MRAAMVCPMHNLRPKILADCLGLAIGETSTRLSPAQGLRLAEQLARASFRAALSEEAASLAAPPAPRRASKNHAPRA